MPPIFTAEALARVRAYHAPYYVYGLLELVARPALLAAIARFGTRPLFSLAGRWAGDLRAPVLARLWRGEGGPQALLFAVLLTLGLGLAQLPGDLWLDWYHEHQFGMSTATGTQFSIDLVKAHAVGLAAVAALVVGVLGLARRSRSWWWALGLVGAVGLYGARALDADRGRLFVAQTRLPEGSLRQRISALMARAGVDFDDVRVEATSSRSVRLQAYFAGAGPTRAIVLNDTLVRALDEDEVLAVIAHEAGHVGDVEWPRWLLAGAALVAWLGVVECLFRRAAAKGWFGVHERADVRVLPLILLVFELAVTAATPLSAAMSRSAELKADAFAVALTGDPSAFASMLTTVARVNQLDPSPPAWVRLWQGHPPVAERLAAIR